MTKWPYSDWLSTSVDAWALSFEASAVIGLRMMKVAQGGPASEAEMRRMVAEKVKSALQLQSAFLGGRMGDTPVSSTKTVLRHYRRKVAANRRRLALA